MNFRLGQKISGYLTDDMPFDGYIIGFAGQTKKHGPLARVKFYNAEGTGVARLDTCHPMEVEKIKHSKKTFLAAASRVSPVLAFKNPKARRDYLERLWIELCDFTDKE
jgi:hypothetical protein